MHPDLPNPDLIEQLRVVAKGGPAWWVYAAFVVLSFLGATLGFQYVAPSERIDKVEARVSDIEHHDLARERQDSMVIRYMCVKTTVMERQYIGLRCQ